MVLRPAGTHDRRRRGRARRRPAENAPGPALLSRAFPAAPAFSSSLDADGGRENGPQTPKSDPPATPMAESDERPLMASIGGPPC